VKTWDLTVQVTSAIASVTKDLAIFKEFDGSVQLRLKHSFALSWKLEGTTSARTHKYMNLNMKWIGRKACATRFRNELNRVEKGPELRHSRVDRSVTRNPWTLGIHRMCYPINCCRGGVTSDPKSRSWSLKGVSISVTWGAVTDSISHSQWQFSDRQ
jgi:hypothetical protein